MELGSHYQTNRRFSATRRMSGYQENLFGG
jgi:hypothetical protein